MAKKIVPSILFFRQIGAPKIQRKCLWVFGGGGPEPPVKIMEVSAAEGRLKIVLTRVPPVKFFPGFGGLEIFGRNIQILKVLAPKLGYGGGGLSSKNFGLGNIYAKMWIRCLSLHLRGSDVAMHDCLLTSRSSKIFYFETCSLIKINEMLKSVNAMHGCFTAGSWHQGRLSFSIFQILGGMKAKKSQKPSEF